MLLWNCLKLIYIVLFIYLTVHCHTPHSLGGGLSLSGLYQSQSNPEVNWGVIIKYDSFILHEYESDLRYSYPPETMYFVKIYPYVKEKKYTSVCSYVAL